MYEETLRASVRAGIQYLDDRTGVHAAHIPADWRKEISWDDLDLADPYACILWYLFCREWFGCLMMLGLTDHDAISLGFQVRQAEPGNDSITEDEEYEILTRLWREEAKT